MRISEPIAIIVIICLLLASALIVLDIMSFVELKKKRRRMTEEAREALMRLTMCAREECEICKHEKECNFDTQCELATKNMQIVLSVLRGEEND